MTSIRKFQSTEKPVDEQKLRELPTHLPVGVYYRQSSDIQIGNVSTSIQTIDQVNEMKRLGWREDDILLIDADAGVSGALKIDEREGMNQLFGLINEGRIGAVACQDEDRLFRDVTQIQVNIFIDACLRNRVIVITPSLTYVFHHPQMGSFYMKQFRFKSEMAAEYLNFIKQRLGGARNRILREGKFAGGRVALGYMVDMREDSPTYRRLVAWPEMAAITRAIFETFVACNGSIYRAARTLRDTGITIPDFRAYLPPAGFHYPPQGGTKNGLLTAAAIKYIVTNPVYIGHWMYKGAILHWNNHEPIIDEALFFRAFNFLSPYALDGSQNPHYRPNGERVRRSYAADRLGVPRPLLGGLIYLHYEGKWRKLGVDWQPLRKYYGYEYHRFRQEQDSWSRKAAFIDEAVEYYVIQRILAAYEKSRVDKAREDNLSDSQREALNIQARIDTIEREMRSLEDAFRDAGNPRLRANLERQYTERDDELQRLQALRLTTLNRVDSDHVLQDHREQYLEAVENWPDLMADEKKQIIARMIRRIEITDYDKFRVRLRIYWHDRTETDCLTWQTRKDAKWTYEQKLTIVELAGQGAFREDFLAACPEKSWPQIRGFIRLFLPDAPIPRPRETSAAWQTRMDNDERFVSRSENRSASLFIGGYKLPIVLPFPMQLLRRPA